VLVLRHNLISLVFFSDCLNRVKQANKGNKPPDSKKDDTLNTLPPGSPDLHVHNATHDGDTANSGEKEQRPMKKPSWWDHLGDSKNSNRVVAIFTIIIALTGIAYAAFAAMQWCVMRQSFIAANMPSVGVSMVEVRHLNFDGQGKPIQSETRTDKSTSLGFIVTIKNSGSITAENFAASWRGFIDGVEQPVQPSPSRPTKMLPGREIKLVGQTGQPATYLTLINGKGKLALEITVSYDDPEHKNLAYCEREEYDYTIDAFKSLGACP
jgi:hypothetical protein